MDDILKQLDNLIDKVKVKKYNLEEQIAELEYEIDIIEEQIDDLENDKNVISDILEEN